MEGSRCVGSRLEVLEGLLEGLPAEPKRSSDWSWLPETHLIFLSQPLMLGTVVYSSINSYAPARDLRCCF